MKPGGGKAKGSGFEGQVAKKLSVALTPLSFIRTQGSGARVGGKNFATIGKMFGADALKLFVGDVVPTNERDNGLTFLWSVETKFYKTQDNFTSLASGSANLYKWFKESQEDAVKIDKRPMLVFKWNHTSIFAAVKQSDAAAVIGVDDKTYSPLYRIDECFSISKDDQTLIVFEFEELLKHPSFWYNKNEM
jgi:hypothetical protein